LRLGAVVSGAKLIRYACSSMVLATSAAQRLLLFGGAKRRSGKRAGRGLQIGQPAFSGKPDELGIRSHAGLGLDEIVIILNSLHAEIET
jgi:hypothetical protein